ncbi:O-antigen ligase family protein [Sphingobacterium multivorum]|uniref:O-antigen ligase family protein n=1 Tax=Sphingobacterium multivorum TaxID=28454 RepID=UPI0028AD43EC|nr:O-antigen ligase family protein [Sphingobacterium multivorum]
MRIDKLKFSLLTLVILVISFQFSSIGLKEFYEPLRTGIMVLVVLLSIISLANYKVLANYKSVIVLPGIILLLFFAVLLVFSGVSTHDVDYSPVRDALLVVFVLLISITTEISETKLNRLKFIFVFTISISALSIPLFIGQGFQIEELYLPVPKNQLAPIFASAVIIGLYSFSKEENRMKKFILFLSFSSLILVLIVLRGRSALIALLFGLILYFIFVVRRIKYLLIAILILAVTFPLYFDFLYKSFFLNQNVNDINSISSGRTEVYLEGIEILSKSLLFGKMYSNLNTSYTIHNYLLKNLVEYGLLSLLFFYFYFRIFWSAIRGLYIENRAGRLNSILVLMLFLISLTEYTYPFAPGSSVFFTFILFGQTLKLNKI